MFFPFFSTKEPITVLEAISNRQTDRVFALLETNPDLTITDDMGRTALHVAAQQDEAEVIPLLIYSGALIDSKGACDKTPLQLASVCGSLSAVQALVDCGADVNAIDEFKNTPLHHAGAYNQTSVFNWLYQNVEAVDKWAINSEGYTAAQCLSFAQNNRHARVDGPKHTA